MLKRAAELGRHPVFLIVVWIPTIAFLPAQWITIGEELGKNANLTRVALGAGGLVAILVATGSLRRSESTPAPVTPTLALKPGDRARRHTNPHRRYGPGVITEALSDLSRREAVKTIEAELVAIIDEGRTVRATNLGSGSPQARSIWETKTRGFLSTVFGEAERQRFESDRGTTPTTEATAIANRIWALEQLRDRRGDWELTVRGSESRDAIDERRSYDYGDRILGCGTPAERFNGMTTTPEQLAQRSARRFLTELDAIGKTVRDALDSGAWWDVRFAGLPADKWDRLSDDFGQLVPHTLFETVSGAYTEADQLNKLNNSASERGRLAQPLDDLERTRLMRLRELVRAARVSLREFCGVAPEEDVDYMSASVR